MVEFPIRYKILKGLAQSINTIEGLALYLNYSQTWVRKVLWEMIAEGTITEFHPIPILGQGKPAYRFSVTPYEEVRMKTTIQLEVLVEVELDYRVQRADKTLGEIDDVPSQIAVSGIRFLPQGRWHKPDEHMEMDIWNAHKAVLEDHVQEVI